LLAFYLTVFGGFLCFIPLALYCVALAGINRRPHPSLVSGVADFTWALLGLSGFLIVGGPVLLAGLHSAWRSSVFRGSFEAVGALLDEPAWPWVFLWGAYFAAVLTGVIVVYRQRRVMSIICHVDPATAMAALTEVCGRLDLPVAQRGASLVLGGAARSAVLDVRPAPVLRSVTLTWRSDPAAMRPIFEEELRRTLLTVSAPDNPLATWLLTAATGLFIVQVVAFGLFLLFLYYARH
jgi:hypothetical protein